MFTNWIRYTDGLHCTGLKNSAEPLSPVCWLLPAHCPCQKAELQSSEEDKVGSYIPDLYSHNDGLHWVWSKHQEPFCTAETKFILNKTWYYNLWHMYHIFLYNAHTSSMSWQWIPSPVYPSGHSPHFQEPSGKLVHLAPAKQGLERQPSLEKKRISYGFLDNFGNRRQTTKSDCLAYQQDSLESCICGCLWNHLCTLFHHIWGQDYYKGDVCSVVHHHKWQSKSSIVTMAPSPHWLSHKQEGKQRLWLQ